ncbi:MAG: hypothetical protein DGJ47_000453 [Rickettsiaceae bacterium]
MLLNILSILLAILLCIVFFNFLRINDVFTKLLMVNTGTSIASLLICALGTYQVNSSYIDIAIIYFLLSVIASAAYLKYFLQQKNKGSCDGE